MRLSEHAAKHVETRGLRATTIVTNARRFETITGIADPAKVSIEVLNAFRDAGKAIGLSPVTIEKTITDVATVIRSVLGELPRVGERLKQPRPKPMPPSLSELNSIFQAAKSKRIRRWLAITYWTGARISDSVTLYRSIDKPVDVIRHTAKKTGIHHVWPVPGWLREWMPPVEPMVFYSVEWFGRMLRNELAECCRAANVPVRTPKNIRQLSITEWTNANLAAGCLVHGCGITDKRVMQHYLDPLPILESAAPRVRLPSCFGASGSAGTEDALLQSFRRLDPAAQGLIAGTAERLAAG